MPHAPSYLLKNSFGIYHLRLAVPKHLRYVVGKREIKKTLRTGNRREALRKARRLATILQDRFDEMTFDNSILGKNLEFESIKTKSDGTREVTGVKLDPDNLEADTAALDKLLGTNQQPAPVATNSITLQKLIEEYLEAMAEDCNTRTLAGYKSHLDTFLEIIGDIQISEITRKQARGAVSTLKKLPPNRNKLKAFRDLSIAAIIQLKPEKVLAPTTVKLHIERISALFEFAIAERLTTYNPFTKLKPKSTTRPDKERDKLHFDEISALFAPANLKSHNRTLAKVWIPLIAAFSGMRLEEICQLQASDIMETDGVWCFSINDYDKKQLKNKSAHRNVPIHSKLINAGILNLLKNKKGRIFSGLSKVNGKYGHGFSKWFKKHREKCHVTADGKTFHSFRHTVATQFKQEKVPVTEAAALLGHSVNGETYGRYGKAYKPSQLQEVIEIIDYKFALDAEKWTAQLGLNPQRIPKRKTGN